MAIQRLLSKSKLIITLLFLSLMTIRLVSFADSSILITHVVLDRTTLRHGDVPIAIQFRLSEPASVQLSIYDARNFPVRVVSSPTVFSTGVHTLQWDGLDDRQQPVPPEAYFYTLTATASDGSQTIYDLTDKTGGQPVTLEDVRYDETSGIVHYAVPRSARVFLRGGIINAFVIKTLINGAVREKGVYQEPWNGRDDNGVFSVNGHPNFDLSGEGYQLSDNAIIVSSSEERLAFQPTWINEGIDKSQIRVQAQKTRGLHRYAYLPVDQSRDVPLTLHFPANIKRNENALPIVSGAVPLTVDLPLKDALAMESQRVEIVFFLNNLLLYENEASYFPYTWTWNTTKLPPGEHFLTAFAVSYSGHYGVSIHKVVIEENDRESNAGLANNKP